MNRGSAIVAILVAFVGGFAVGNINSAPDEEVREVAALGRDNGAPSEAAAPGAAARGGSAGAAAADDDVVRFRVPVTEAQPSKGPADALVTIVEFSEFQCPFCSRVLPTTARILDEYEGQVRIVWRNNPLPFHQQALPASIAAMEAYEQGGADKFWEMHDLLFENQRQLSREDIERYGQQVGLNMGELRAALDNEEHKDAIEADQTLARQIGARGTPNFFINGRQLTGAQPFEAFKTVIDEEIATARRLTQNGTPAAGVYAALTRNGRTSPAPAAPRPGADRPQQARRQPDPAAVYKLELRGRAEPQEGPDDALVTIVEFSDFQCPFCSRVNPTIDSIMEEYGRDVRVIWMNNPLPFHQEAGPAAQAALEAYDQGGSEKFWQMHEILFENQRALSRENLEQYAERLGLNMAQFRAALDNNEHQADITAQQAIARRFGASGTPSFFINGRNLRGAQPLAAFKAVIDQELARARALVENGTPRSGVYAAAVAEGATEPQFVGGGDAAPAQPNRPDPDQVYEIAVPRNAPSKGAANARVVIQEFSDFQCPFCSRVNPTISRIMEEYGDRVRIVWRNYPLPFHQEAGPAAQASLEVFRQRGNEGFWAYHDLLFQNQRALSRENLEQYAEQVGGVNMAQFRAALDNETHKATVDADMAAVRTAGARIGTPSFFINGRLLQGAQPFEAFQTAINRALEEE